MRGECGTVGREDCEGNCRKGPEEGYKGIKGNPKISDKHCSTNQETPLPKGGEGNCSKCQN